MTIEVTQADRDAAEKWGTGPVYNMQHLAEAFARHRIAAEQAMRERAAQVAEIYARGSLVCAEAWTDEECDWWETGCVDSAQAIASAIRALKIEGE